MLVHQSGITADKHMLILGHLHKSVGTMSHDILSPYRFGSLQRAKSSHLAVTDFIILLGQLISVCLLPLFEQQILLSLDQLPFIADAFTKSLLVTLCDKYLHMYCFTIFIENKTTGRRFRCLMLPPMPDHLTTLDRNGIGMSQLHFVVNNGGMPNGIAGLTQHLFGNPITITFRGIGYSIPFTIGQLALGNLPDLNLEILFHIGKYDWLSCGSCYFARFWQSRSHSFTLFFAFT
ncbi:hypothetical protein D3C79_690780 [compost metagenome]